MAYSQVLPVAVPEWAPETRLQLSSNAQDPPSDKLRLENGSKFISNGQVVPVRLEL